MTDKENRAAMNGSASRKTFADRQHTPLLRTRLGSLSLRACLTAGLICPAAAQDAEDLSKQLANPIASLISVPFKMSYDTDIGPDDSGDQVQVKVQPVLPVSLNDDWNMISRTILPIVYQDDLLMNLGEQFGLSDTSQSLFFSPKMAGPSGIIWGIGPAFLLPTGTDPLLSSGKWGAGPTGVVLKQTGPLTVGLLANHIWSFAGSERTPDVNATYMQPFVSYNVPGGWTFSLNTETTYNWTADEWSVPVNAQVAKLTAIGNQPVQLFAAGRYWAVSPDNAAEGFGFSLGMTFLFPAGSSR